MSAKGIDRAEIDRIAARINGMYRNRPDPRPSVTRGTVQAVGDCTYDVAMPDGAVLLGVKRTVGAGGASVGDECLIEWIAGSAYVTGVVARGQANDVVEKRGNWYVIHYGNLVACWVPSVSPSFTGGNEFVRIYTVNFPIEFSDIPTVQVTKADSLNSETELQERIEINTIATKAVDVKCNAYSGTVPVGETTKFSVLAVGIVQM